MGKSDGASRRWRIGWWAAGAWLGLALLWVWAILSQDPAPSSLGRWLLPAAIVLTLAWAVRRSFHSLREGSPGQRTLLLMLTLALAVRLLGIDHEVEERAYRDEGTYYHHATKINQGKVLRYSFVYPHLLYYSDAFALWSVSLHPAAWDAASRRVFGVSEPLGQSWLALRLLAALISVLAVAAVYRVGERFAGPELGPLSGALGAALLIFSPLYNDGSHLIISDVPSSSLAAVSWMFAAGLLLEERRRDYLLAGLFAGLAAAAKYPAGVVAVAILAAWVRGRWTDRKWNWNLFLAGGVSLTAFLAVMPTFFFHPRLAVLGDRGMLFGLRQYSGGGWIGVMPESLAAYYGVELARSFGLAALVLGGLGLVIFGLGSPGSTAHGGRKRWIWLLAFPLLYLGLIVSMNMVVRRNLYPALPPLAALLGLGLAAATHRLTVPATPWRKALGAGVLLLALAQPVWSTSLQTLSLTRPSTREAAAAWIRRHLPPGAAILKESYTPRQGLEHYALWQHRFAGRLSLEDIRHPAQDFLLLAKPAYGRFLRDEALRKPHHFEISRRYREILRTFELVAEFPPSETRRGPWLELYRIPNSPATATGRRAFTGSEAFVPYRSMRPKGEPTIRFGAPGQWVVFKDRFLPGSYRLTPLGSFARPPLLRLRDLGNSLLADGLTGTSEVQLASDRKILVYVLAEPGDQLRGLTVEPLADP